MRLGSNWASSEVPTVSLENPINGLGLSLSDELHIGPQAVTYLEAHGYERRAILNVDSMFASRSDDEQFISRVSSAGMNSAQARWLLGYIQQELNSLDH